MDEVGGGMLHVRDLWEINPLKYPVEEFLPTSCSLKEGGSVHGKEWKGGQYRDEEGLFTKIWLLRLLAELISVLEYIWKAVWRRCLWVATAILTPLHLWSTVDFQSCSDFSQTTFSKFSLGWKYAEEATLSGITGRLKIVQGAVLVCRIVVNFKDKDGDYTLSLLPWSSGIYGTRLKEGDGDDTHLYYLMVKNCSCWSW